MAKAVVLVVVLVALLVAPAEGRERMTFEFASAVAVDYWAARGVPVPCRPRAAIRAWRDALDSVDMLAVRESCTVDVMPWADMDRRGDAIERANYCFDVVHEVGHLAGLEHPDFPGLTEEQRAFVAGTVMDEWGEYPFGCEHPRQWAVRQGWRKPPRWVRRSPVRARRLWLDGHVRRAWAVRVRLVRR